MNRTWATGVSALIFPIGVVCLSMVAGCQPAATEGLEALVNRKGDDARSGLQAIDVKEFQLLGRGAEQGDRDAENNLGVLYEEGRGAPADISQAIYWYRKAARQGLATAQTNLGRLYAQGRGVPKDYAVAKSWFQKAAEQGDADAMGNLGRVYGEGDGVRPDAVEGLKWLILSGKQYQLGLLQEPLYNVKNREGLMSRMMSSEVADAHQRANEWFAARE